MKKKANLHVGSTFESWLDEQGIRDGVSGQPCEGGERAQARTVQTENSI
jgi:hypothetical protein